MTAPKIYLATKAWAKLNWSPKISYQQLLAEITDYDPKSARMENLLKQHGFRER